MLKEIWAWKCAKWGEALEEAQEALQEAGLTMQAKVPSHQLDYYIHVTTQAITRSAVKPCKRVTKWNVFVAKETCKRNEEREPDLASKLERFFLGGIDGLARNYVERLIQLKSATATLIKEKLINGAGSQIPRMVYINFDQAITLKHALVLKGWPLPQFCCPSHITACSDIELLYNAWKSGAAHFVKLNNNEYKQWRSQYLQQHAATLATSAQADSINPNGESIYSSTLTVEGSANSNAAVTNLPVQAATDAPTVSDAPILSPAPASFLNFGLDGTMVPNKTRKTRKDKGVP
ncbi:hypothetical protein H1R20_g11324, partial [Candolleomyces eurysporus]